MENLKAVRKRRWDRHALIEQALRDNPRDPGESQNQYCVRVGELCGAHRSHVLNILTAKKHQAIGDEVRRKEQEKMVPMLRDDTWDVGPVRDFKGWPIEFGKLKAVTEAYLMFARLRDESYAVAFLMNIRDELERGIKRAILTSKT